MGFWNVYFICKIALHLAGSIALHPWFNLALAAVLLLPLPLPHPGLRVPRQIAAVVAAVALLYYESFLPPFRSLISQAGAVTGFSLDYLGELVTRVVEPHLVVWLVLLVAVYTVLTRWLRVTSFVLLALLVVPFLPLPRAGSGATAPVGAVAAAPSPYARVDDGSRRPGPQRIDEGGVGVQSGKDHDSGYW